MADTATDTVTKPVTILLVDDEDSVQKLLTYPLERDGFRVVHAMDGEEALTRFAEEDIDIDLRHLPSGVHLPGIAGGDAATGLFLWETDAIAEPLQTFDVSLHISG